MRTAPLLLLICGAAIRAELLSPVWVELGEGGRALARVVAAAPEDCPGVEIDVALQRMSVRQPIPAGFRPLCELAIPANAKSARVNGRALALPRPDPARIVVIGDTGCRIQGGNLQDCNDPKKWPFEHVAGTAARARADLVVHVGDYLYREDPCPASAQEQCGGTPSGDNWGAWNADFFKPAAALLAASPWIFSRGNHENCQRSWRGWFYYLDPRPWTGVCQTASPPYSIQLGMFQAIEFDSSSVDETQVIPEQLNIYAAQLASLHATHAWLLDHHPFWAVRPGLGFLPPTPQTAVLEDAWDRAAPKGIDMVLSGHTHLFEILSFGENRPVQIVAGDGGSSLADPLPERLNGVDIHGVMVAASQNQHEFGYTLFTRRGTGFDMSLRDLQDRELVSCRIDKRTATCSGRVVGNAAR